MRNFSLSLILVMFVALFTTSCDDDDYYCSPIEGNWEIVDPPNVDYNEYSFFHDGTGAYYIEDYYGNSTYHSPGRSMATASMYISIQAKHGVSDGTSATDTSISTATARLSRLYMRRSDQRWNICPYNGY